MFWFIPLIFARYFDFFLGTSSKVILFHARGTCPVNYKYNTGKKKKRIKSSVCRSETMKSCSLRARSCGTMNLPGAGRDCE